MHFCPSRRPAADTDVCAGVGTANLSGPLTYPISSSALPAFVFTAPRTVAFAYELAPGACVVAGAGADVRANGSVTGWCGLSGGDGITNTDHRFSFIGIGGLLIVTGEAIGAVVAVPNAAAGQSCTDAPPANGATQFLIVGGALGHHVTDCRLRSTGASTPPPLIHPQVTCSYPVPLTLP